VVHFVNLDLLAAGLSPLKPELAAVKAGKLFLQELDRLAGARLDFAFESTLSGLAYTRRLKRWKTVGYRIEIVFLRRLVAQLAASNPALREKTEAFRKGGIPPSAICHLLTPNSELQFWLNCCSAWNQCSWSWPGCCPFESQIS
jgi:hypothetical protein